MMILLENYAELDVRNKLFNAFLEIVVIYGEVNGKNQYERRN